MIVSLVPSRVVTTAKGSLFKSKGEGLEPIATRPLAIQKNATWYSYSHDLTKNVTELYQSDGLIATTYDYSPYGAATSEGLDQPIQYSSEYHDAELALTYYNYRHYNPTDGRWITRDPIEEEGENNLYV